MREDKCGPVPVDEHNPSDPNCDYAPAPDVGPRPNAARGPLIIRIFSRRAGIIWLAATVKDDGDVAMTWGLTEEGARRRLIRRDACEKCTDRWKCTDR